MTEQEVTWITDHITRGGLGVSDAPDAEVFARRFVVAFDELARIRGTVPAAPEQPDDEVFTREMVLRHELEQAQRELNAYRVAAGRELEHQRAGRAFTAADRDHWQALAVERATQLNGLGAQLDVTRKERDDAERERDAAGSALLVCQSELDMALKSRDTARQDAAELRELAPDGVIADLAVCQSDRDTLRSQRDEARGEAAELRGELYRQAAGGVDDSRCRHEAWEQYGDVRKCADCGEPPTQQAH